MALRFREPFDLQLDLSRRGVHADIRLFRVVSSRPVIVSRSFFIALVLGSELELRCQHLFHQQARGDGLERIVHCLRHRPFRGVRLGDEISETSTRLARRVAGGAADDLDDLREAGTVADRQRMLAPDPVEALLRHAERDDDVHMIPIILLGRIFQRGGNLFALRRVIVHQIGDLQDLSFGGLHQLETRLRISSLPFAQPLDDVLHFLDLVLCALPRIDVWNVKDRLLAGLQDIEDAFLGIVVLIPREVVAGVEEISDIELLQKFVAVELLVVGVSDGIEFRFIVRMQHRLRVAAKIRPGHRHEVDLVPQHELADVFAQAVVWVRRNVVKLVHGDQAIIENLRPEFLHRETERRVRADQSLSPAFEELLH